MLAVLLPITASGAETFVPPEDQTQSATYWRAHTIAPDTDAQAAWAHGVFRTLLRSWDNSRVAPQLFVVRASTGPWAASLADGSILLSQAALQTCAQFGAAKADHLLAFVLAHELAHQRADDLWHRKFFLLAGTQAPAVQRQLRQSLNPDAESLADLERREAQADHDGLVTMATVGYDPFLIVDKRDFFSAWVENIWNTRCGADSQAADACAQARARALRAQTQLSTIATQATLFELGVQKYIAGHYESAQRFFVAFGRDYPSRAVHTAIALTDMARALDIKNKLIDAGALPGPHWWYPLVLDAEPVATPLPGTITAKRGVDLSAQRERERMHQLFEHAVESLEKAIRLEPNHRASHLLLAVAYLAAGNTPMAQGVLQGKYIAKFGADAASDLLACMLAATNGADARPEKLFAALLQRIDTDTLRDAPLPERLLRFGAYFNYAAYLRAQNQSAQAQQIWDRAADRARASGESLLFRAALTQLNATTERTRPLEQAPQVRSLRLGDRLTGAPTGATRAEFLLEGERYTLLRYADGAKFVLDTDNRVLHAWQDQGAVSLSKAIAVGDAADRPLKTLGMPSRYVVLTNGEYLAYDALGLAVRLHDGRVAGWFLYGTI
jgi:tetratricopeptide (TPR) repeat protein